MKYTLPEGNTDIYTDIYNTHTHTHTHTHIYIYRGYQGLIQELNLGGGNQPLSKPSVAR